MLQRPTTTAGFVAPAQDAPCDHFLPALIALALSLSIVIMLTAVTMTGARAMPLF